MEQIKGYLAEVPPIQLLANTFEREWSGILYFKKTDIIHSLYFRDGILLGATTNFNQIKLETLLVEEKLASPEIIEELKKQQHLAELPGEVFIQKGVISKEDLIRISKVQVERILADVLNWHDGFYQMDRDLLPQLFLYLEIDLVVAMSKIILADLDVVSHWDENGSFETELERVTDKDTVTKYGFSGEQLQLLNTFSSRNPVSVLFRDFPDIDRKTLLSNAYLFIELGLLRMTDQIPSRLLRFNLINEDFIAGKSAPLSTGDTHPLKIPTDRSLSEIIESVDIKEGSSADSSLQEIFLEEEKKSRRFGFIFAFVFFNVAIALLLFLLLGPKKEKQPVKSGKEAEISQKAGEKGAVLNPKETDNSAAEKMTKNQQDPIKSANMVTKGGIPARTLLLDGDLVGAAAAWLQEIGDQRQIFTIMLELDCLQDSVLNAFHQVNEKDEFFILSISRDGRDCYLVLWGKFISRIAAESEINRVGDYFFQQSPPPRVIQLSEYLQ